MKTALQRYNAEMEGEIEPSPIERLRFFLSQALTGQNWIDVEQFIDAITPTVVEQKPVAWLNRDGTSLGFRDYGVGHTPLYLHPSPAEVEALRLDAERYRWLRDANADLEPFTLYVGRDAGPDDDGAIEWVGSNLDYVIDAAIKESKNETT